MFDSAALTFSKADILFTSLCVLFLTGMFQISPSSTTVNGNVGQLTDSGHRVLLN